MLPPRRDSVPSPAAEFFSDRAGNRGSCSDWNLLAAGWLKSETERTECSHYLYKVLYVRILLHPKFAVATLAYRKKTKKRHQRIKLNVDNEPEGIVIYRL